MVKLGKYFGDVPSPSSLPATSARGITSRTCHTEAGVLTASPHGEQLKPTINPEMVINDDLHPFITFDYIHVRYAEEDENVKCLMSNYIL